MPLLLRNLRLGLDEPEEELRACIARRLRVGAEGIRAYAVVRRALDARRADDLHFVYHVEVALNEPAEAERRRLRYLKPHQAVWLEPTADQTPASGSEPLLARPTIIGFGPAGMFAAWRLALMGYQPIVYERGRDVRRRHRDVRQRFFRQRDFDPESNLLFGEGGAGAYSDGKLYTRVSHPLARTVLEVLYRHGADPDILVNARPHIGSDHLPTICRRLREHLEQLGGEVRFEHRLEDVRIENGRLEALRVNDEWIPCGPTICALGHSARDTVRMLAARGVRIAAKPFQLGVRIEHPQALVDRWQYGPHAGHPRLQPAEYQIVAKGAAGSGGDLFSFCMCPGGVILPTNEAAGLLATNGASRATRNSPYANSGLVITLTPDYFDNDPLAGIAYQEQLERRCFEATGGQYELPVQRACDFLASKPSEGEPETSYPMGARWADLRAVLPLAVSEALTRGLPILDRKLPGYTGKEALITAPETRASAPFRILRDGATREALDVAQLFPVGEGAGYAGGIMSSAIDGLKSADAIISRYAPP